jgi:hypothetical protein
MDKRERELPPKDGLPLVTLTTIYTTLGVDIYTTYVIPMD